LVVGERDVGEILRYSATWQSYVSSDPANLLYGALTDTWGRSERRLFPGALALALAVCGLWRIDRRRVAILALGAVGLVISFGLNSPIYPALRQAVFIYRGLRAPARASILVFVAISALAAYGWARVSPRLGRWRTAALGVVAGVMLVEYTTVMTNWQVLSPTPPAFARFLRQQPPSVLVEFPLPKPDRLDWIYDGLYMYTSTFHWQPTLNGYSGFYPKSYLELLERARPFPNDDSLAYLKTRQVDLIVLHGGFMTPDQLGRWTAYLAERSDVATVAEFPEARGPDVILRLRRDAPAR
jgi:hypothetical protein